MRKSIMKLKNQIDNVLNELKLYDRIIEDASKNKFELEYQFIEVLTNAVKPNEE